ncbi:MAG TPA: helix-turn-helix transcriptional regulator [Acidimicrobiales bacterium]|nr:helix-turn-helix transcriptional regulator [Acidimicrobiales bacterium]
MPRRRKGTLLPLETEILDVALSMLHNGRTEFYGFGIAQAMRQPDESRSLTGHGTLYKALGRLEHNGLLTSRWEDPSTVQGRPPRRLYQLTSRGIEATAAAPTSDDPRVLPGVAGIPA